MSVTFRPFYVARPSVPPTSSTSGGAVFVAHRRINKGGQRSELSPIREEVSLPATITPQTYSDTYAILRDEFLVSLDGISWKIVPSDSDHIGALSVPSYSASWADTTINSNQSATGFSLDFGEFSPSSEPEQTFYMVNIGTSIRSLTFNFLDLITNQVATEYEGLIEISILGVYQALGNNADLSFNQTILWDNPQESLNTISLLLPTLSFAKIQLKLLNFPLGNLSSQVFNLSLSVTSNLSAFSLSYPNTWPSGAFLIDDSSPFTLPIVEQIGDTSIQVNPFQFNANGILRSNLIERTILATTGSRKLIFSNSGLIRVEASSYTLATDETLIATFTLNGTDPFVTDLVYPWPIKPQSFIKLGDTSTLERARFITLGTDLEYADTAGEEMGVTLFENSNLVATSGLTWIELGGTVDKGDRLSPTTNGLGISGSGRLVALEDGISGQFIKAAFVV